MAVTGFYFNGPLHQGSPLDAQLQATLTLLPAHVWYASPNGALNFVNQRTADYLGLPEDHPLRFGTNTGADWDSHIVFLHLDDREQTRRIWSDCLRTGYGGEVNSRVRNAEGAYRWFLRHAKTQARRRRMVGALYRMILPPPARRRLSAPSFPPQRS